MAITTTTAATKTTLASSAVNADLIAAANQSTATNANLAQNQGSAGNSKTNPPQGFEGPSPNLAGVNKPSADSFAPQTATDKQASVDQALGLVSKTDAIRSLAGIGTAGTAGSSAKETLTDLGGSSKTDKPSGDQGFSNQSINFGTNPVASRPTTGATAQGSPANGNTEGVQAIFGSNGGSGGSSSSVSKSAGSGVISNPMDLFSGASLGGPLGAAASDQPVPKPTSGAAGSGLVSQFRNGAEHLLPEDAVKSSKDGRNTTVTVNGAKDVYVNGKFVGHIDAKGNVSYDGAKLPPPPSLSIPDPDNQGVQVSILSGAILDQLNAAKAGKPTSQGGSGDATPVDNGGIPQVVNNGSIAVNQGSINQRNLVGQPGGAALGENVSGGNTGLNGFGRSNGAGATNPGPEAGSPGGDPNRLQDPGAALGGNQPAPPTPQLNGSANSTSNTPSEQTSSVSATLTAGARNLTLTGTATINGTGNALDNLINGNSAANELRGEAGNDSLDGKAGNDLLDGGAGRDQLTGGSGADRFRFSTAGAFGTAQADRITDFSRSEGDRIELSRSAFGLSAGAAVSFQAVNSDADLSRALGSSTLLVQDLRDGSILFNQNGSAAGVGQGGVFAVVSQGLTLQAGDFALGA